MDPALTVVLGVLAHLVGDYLLQSDYMANGKVERWRLAIWHGLTYALPFLLLTQSPAALLIISGSHIVLDRYRAATYVTWLKNQMAPRQRRVAWKDRALNYGYPLDTPAGLAFGLMIVADNTLHLAINTAALLWL